MLVLVAPSGTAQPRYVWVPPEPSTTETIVTAFVHVAAYFWIFVLGSVIGSFLNVVAYRLPKGMPLLWPPSSCPSCGNRIAIRDNVPVLGWLILKGKCRNCGQPISPRYPIVEAAVGGLFVLLAAVELFSGGANLPSHQPNDSAAAASALLLAKPLLIGQYLFHLAWLSTVVAVVLIDLERKPLPAKKVLAWMGMIAVASVALAPDLLPVKWDAGIARLNALLQSGAGLLVGLALGFFRERRWGGPVGTVLALTGLYFGQQAVVSALLLGLLLTVIGTIGWRLATRTQAFSVPPMSLWVAVGAFIHLLIWRLWVLVPQLPGPETPWWATALYLLICVKA